MTRNMALIMCALMLTGCRTVGFYHQAVTGHMALLLKRKPIETIVGDPATPSDLRDKLTLVRQLCRFAETNLNLPSKNNYLYYADLARPYVVWDVYAAPEFSLESKVWWYPFVGRLSYRGYFKESRAHRYAAYLERQGYDVFVAGIDAYSTLGWFRDPVLNTFIDREETDLADLLFHELAHQKFFARGDTDLNEAFATTVAREGVRRWLIHQGNTKTLAAWENRTRRQDEFVALILAMRERLESLYTQHPLVSKRQKSPASGNTSIGGRQSLRETKAAHFQNLNQEYGRMKERWGGTDELDPWFSHPVNNARLNAEATYFALMPTFQKLLLKKGKDLNRFYSEVQRLNRVPREERLTTLEHLATNDLPRLVRDLPRKEPLQPSLQDTP